MNPQALLMVLELITKTVKLAPEVMELIRKAKAGETVTEEEIANAERQAEEAVDEWDRLNDD